MTTNTLQAAMRRGLGLLLTLAMLLSFTPGQAFAYAEGDAAYASIAAIPLTAVQAGSWAALSSEVAAAGATPTTIEITDNLSLPAGAAYNAIIIAAGQDITLTSKPGALHTLTRTAGSQRHFLVDGSLRLENIALHGSYPIHAGNHGGIEVRAGGSLYMEAGSAVRYSRHTGNTSASAVLVAGANAAFTMNGGEISHNSTLSGGITPTGSATVFVNNGAVFTMNGGAIRYNTGRFGGGVRIGQTVALGNRMYMNGGEIHHNTAFFGGGVNLENGMFTITQGAIRDNIATAFQNNTALALSEGRGGGGVFIQNSGIFNMEGGVIRNNRSYTHGGGVMSATPASNQFNMTGGVIRDNTAARTGGGVRITSGVFTMGSGTLQDGTVTFGTITGNTAGYDGGGVWLGTGSATGGNARLNLTANAGEITNNTALYGDGGGIFTSSHNSYPASLLPAHYPNILALAPFAVRFSSNVAGGGKFEPPFNPQARPFGHLLNNYDINYRGPHPVALITFSLNGGNVSGNPASVSFPVAIGGMINIADIPSPPGLNRLLYTFLGWTRRGDPASTLLQAGDIADMAFTQSAIFDARWYPLSPITITYLSGTNGAFEGGETSKAEVLIDSGDYPSQVPVPIPDPGWAFIGWTRDGGVALLSTAELMALFIDADTNFTTQWGPIPAPPPLASMPRADASTPTPTPHTPEPTTPPAVNCNPSTGLAQFSLLDVAATDWL